MFGLNLVAVPPPSSAAAVIAALRVLEGAPAGWDASTCSARRHASADLHPLALCWAGYSLPLAGNGVLGLHRTVEAMKHAFAMR